MGTKKSRDPARVSRQVGAVPLRRDGDGVWELLLVTSRETKRWVVPKGNRIKGQTRAQSAATEALEEAGVSGRIASEPFGSYLYWKRRDTHFALCQVDLYVLEVTATAPDWKERGERDLAWVPLDEAADLVIEPGLQSALRSLASPGGVAGAT